MYSHIPLNPIFRQNTQSKLAQPRQFLLRSLDQPMMGLHGRYLSIPPILHQKLGHVLLQQPLDQLLQPGVLFGYPKHLLQGLGDLGLDLEYLFVHLMEMGVVGDLVRICPVTFLFLAVLVDRDYPIALPESLDVLEHRINALQTLLQPTHAQILHPLVPQLDWQSPTGANLSLYALAKGGLVSRTMRGQQYGAVIRREQFFVGRQERLVMVADGYFGEFCLGLDCCGGYAQLDAIGLHQQILCCGPAQSKRGKNQYQLKSQGISRDISYSLWLLSSRLPSFRTGRVLCRMDLKDFPLSGMLVRGAAGTGTGEGSIGVLFVLGFVLL